MSGSPTKPFSSLNFSPTPGWSMVLFLSFLFFVGVVGNVVGQEPSYTHDVANSKNLDYFSLTLADAGNPEAKLNRFIIAVDVNAQGEHFVLTYGNGIKKVSPTGGLIDFIPNQNDRLSNPLDFAINSDGNFFVATNESNRRFIRVYSPQGLYLPNETLGDGSYGSGADKFRGPVGLTFDKNDNLYVADHYIGDANPPPSNPSFIKIYKKDASGNYKNNLLKEFDRIQGILLNFPYRLAVNSAGLLYMAELGQENKAKVRIIQFDANFNPTQIGLTSDLTNQVGSPGSIVIDKFDNIFVADLGNLVFSEVLKATNDVDVFYDIFETIKTGIRDEKFSVKIYNSNNSFRSTILSGIDLPIDLAISPCGSLNVLNSIFDGQIRSFFGQRYPDVNIDFDLEIYKRASGYDTEPPVLSSCPSNIIVDVDSGQNYATVTYPTPTATDNCSVPVISQIGPIAGSRFNAGTTTIIKFVATDATGNTSDCSFSITVNPAATPPDTEKPVFTSCPTNITIYSDPDLCGAVVDYAIPTATDNIGEPTVTLTSGHATGQIFAIGPTVVTYEAKDAAGNIAECSFTVTVNDNQKPTVTCPQNINETVPFGTTKKVVVYSAPVVDDNCAIPTIEQTSGFPSGSEFPLGTTTNTFLVTDTSGNTNTCSFTITITESADNQKPIFTSCPSNIAQNVDPDKCGAIVNYSIPAATDNSGNPSVTLTAGFPPGQLFPVGKTTVTYRAKDAAGNVENCSFEVVITDNVEPVIVCKENIIETVPIGQTGKTVNYEAPIPNDNCADYTVDQTEGKPSGSEFPIGSTLNTFVITDSSGNSSYCSFTVTIKENIDTEDPVISCLDNIAQNVDPGLCGSVVSYNTPTATDNTGTPTITLKSGLSSGQIFPVGTTIVIYEAEDAAGNTAQCTFEVTITDNINPSVTCPTDITQKVENGASTKIINFNPPSVDDNCAIPTIEQTGGLPSGSEFPIGSTVNTFRITDTSGNTVTCSFTVKIEKENEPPFQLECIGNYTVELEHNSLRIPTSEFVTGDLTGIEFKIGEQYFSCADIGTKTITIEATKLSTGETDTCTVEVEIKDVGKPFMVCFAEDQPRYFVEGETYILEHVFEGRFSDFCTPTEDLVWVQDPPVGTEYTEPGTYPVTITVTDKYNNVDSCTVNIILEKVATAPPTFSCINTSIDLEPDANCDYIVGDYKSRVSNFQNFTSLSVQQNIAAGEKITEDSLIILSVYDNEELVGTCEFWLILKPDNLPEITQCAPGFTATLTNGEYILENYISGVGISDSCEETTLQQIPAPSTPITQTTEVQIQLLDNENSIIDSCTFTITIESGTDPDPPAFDCLIFDIILQPNENCEYIVGNYSDGVYLRNFQDGSVVQSVPPGTQITRNTLVILEVMEGDVLVGTCEFEVKLADNITPRLSCPATQTEFYNPDEGFVLKDYRDLAEYNNCGIASITQSPPRGTIIYSNTPVQIVVTSTSNIVEHCEFMVILSEEEVLDITCVADQTIQLTDSCSFILEDYTGDAQVNFAGASVVQSPPAGTVIDSQTTIKLTATLNGETDECTFQVIPNDIVAPELTCIDNETQFELVNGTLTLAASDLVISATDNCSVNLSISQSTFTAPGTYSVTVTAADGNGNFSECTKNIKVVEPSSSNFTCRTNDVILTLDATGNAVLKPEDVYTGNPGNTTFTLSKSNFDCLNLGDNNVTVTYSGENSGTCSVKVIVRDEIAPGVRTRNISMVLNQNGVVNLTPELINNGSTDNCGGLTYSIDKTTLRCKDLGDNTVTLIVTDASGNVSTGTATVTLTGTCEEEPEQPGVNDEYIYIYPNPTTGPVYFHVPKNNKIEKVELYDTRGRYILKKEFLETTLRYEVDLSGLQSSVYIFKLTTNKGTEILRVIVK